MSSLNIRWVINDPGPSRRKTFPATLPTMNTMGTKKNSNTIISTNHLLLKGSFNEEKGGFIGLAFAVTC